MASSILNRGEIVTQGLQAGGNPGIGTLANTFLNLFLDNLYRAHDWEFLLKEASITITSGSADVSLSGVTDYRSIRQVHVDDDTYDLKQMDYADAWRMIRVDTTEGVTGDPTHFAVAPDASKLVFYPIPNASTTGKILYYYMPAEMTSDSAIPAYPDALTMVNAVADFAMTYDRDNMLTIAQRNVDVALGKSAAGIPDEGRAQSITLKFDPKVFKKVRND